MKQYQLDSKILYWLFVAGIPITLLGIGSIWMVLTYAQRGPLWFGVIWFALLLYGCYQNLRLPYRIEVGDSGSIRFIGIRATTLQTSEILLVRQTALGGGFVEIRHREGKLMLLQQFNGFHEFIAELKRANPKVELRGC